MYWENLGWFDKVVHKLLFAVRSLPLRWIAFGARVRSGLRVEQNYVEDEIILNDLAQVRRGALFIGGDCL